MAVDTSAEVESDGGHGYYLIPSLYNPIVF